MSCFGGRDEQLYLVELMIGTLILTPDKMKDVGCCQLVVKIKFLDFPIFEISRSDFFFAKPAPPDNKDGSLDFSAGQSCLFTKQPRDLVQAMQNIPLRIGIFRAGDTFPTAESEVPLSGCLCDQVAMAANDPDHPAKPYILKGGFLLVDSGGNASGKLNLELRLTCFGKSITTHYQLQPKSFLFKNDKDDGEFSVKRVLPPRFCGNEQKTIEEAGGLVQVGKCGDNMLPDAFPEVDSQQVTERKNDKAAKGKGGKGGKEDKKDSHGKGGRENKKQKGKNKNKK